MNGLPEQQNPYNQPSPGPAAPVAGGPDRDLLQPEDVASRVERHERGSRRTHLLLGLGLLLLGLLLGRGIYENFLLRQGNDRLAEAVEEQSGQLAVAASGQSSVPGAGFAEPGTILVGPDGKQYVCIGQDGSGAAGTGAAGEAGTSGTAGTEGGEGAAGTSGTAGSAGTSGTAGTAGSTGATGATGPQGATGATGAQGLAGDVSLISMDATYANFGTTASQAIVNIDNRDGVGDLRFNLPGGQNFVVQDNGTTFANFQNDGNVTFANNFGVGNSPTAETLDNAAFVVDGNDQYIEGQLGVEDRIFTDQGVTVGGGSTAYNDGAIIRTPSPIALSTGFSISTTAGDMTLSTGPGGAGGGDIQLTPVEDLLLTPTDDVSISPGGGDINILGVTSAAVLGPANGRIMRFSNVASGQAADILVGSANPNFLLAANDEGSLYLRDNAGAGELWISQGGGIWTQAALGNTNLDQAYNNFGATPAEVVLDGAEGQGDLEFEVGAQDFVVRDAASTMVARIDTGGVDLSQANAATTLEVSKTVLAGEAVSISQATNDEALHITDSNATSPAVLIEQNNIAEVGTGLQVLTQSGANAVQINQAGAGRGLLVNHDGTANNVGVEINWDENELRPELSSPLYIFASNANLSLAGDSSSRRAAILEIDTSSTTGSGDVFNYIALNEGNGGDAKWRVDQTGATIADAAYSSGGADVAEYFATADASLEPGELVTLDGEAGSVRRTSANDAPVGVISSNPSVIGNNPQGYSRRDEPDDVALVGMLGQVPTRVSDEGGEISIGDLIAASSVPGRGRKAQPGEATVGVALSGAKEGVAMVLVSPQHGGLVAQDSSAVAPSEDGSLKSLPLLEDLITDGVKESSDLSIVGTITGGVLAIDGSATFGGAATFAGHITVGEDTAGSVTVAAGETSARVEFAQDYAGAPHVQVTPRDFAPSYRVTDVGTNGFTVELQVAADADVTFDWFAIATKGQTNGQAEAPTVEVPADPVQPVEQVQEAAPVDTQVQPRSWLDRLFSFRG